MPAGLIASGAIAAAATAVHAFAVAPGRVAVTRHVLPIARLPAALEGVRIALVSDVHLPRNVAAAQRTIELIASERPEIVLLGGDIAEDAAAAPALTAFARAVRGSIATLAVLGNWEYGAGLGRGNAAAAYQAAGVPLLVNAVHRIEIGGGAIAVVGLDDLIWGSPDLAAATAAASPADATVWLVHEPVLVDNIPPGIPLPDLVVAGHTHGGQVRLPGWGSIVLPPGSGRYVQGWFRDTAAPLYVSRGIGTSGMHVRLFCRPELPVFTLVGSLRAAAA